MMNKLGAAGLEFPTNHLASSQNKIAVEVSNSNLSGKIDGELSKQQAPLIKTVERTERSDFYQEMQQLQQQLEVISKKLARGEALSSEEERFIAEKSIHLKHKAEQAKEDAEKVKASLNADSSGLLQMESYSKQDSTGALVREMEKRVTEMLESQSQ